MLAIDDWRGCPYVFRQALGADLGLVNGAVARHGEQDVATSPRQRDKGLVVALALLDLARVIGP